MAPSAGHLHKLVVRNVKLLKAAWKAASQGIQFRLEPRLQPIPVRALARQQLHPIAALRQSKNRFYSSVSGVRRLTTSSIRGITHDKASWPVSRTRTAVSSLTSHAPFASTLRPNLTGGALNRTAGGYSLGSGRVGGARHFSHGPAAPAQVVQNVSQAMRAFLISGHKAQFAGTDSRSGEKTYRAVSTLQDATMRKVARLPQATPGSYVDFRINPTITALTPASVIASCAGFSIEQTSEPNGVEANLNTLNTSGLLDVLSIDFSRALKDLAAILNDLKALASLGDLPITYRAETTSTLRIHFPGCDAETVENLCRELGVKRGIVRQDESFDAYNGTEIALLFPFAPSAGSVVSEEDDANYPEGYFEYDHFNSQDVWRDEALFPSGRTSEKDYSTQSNDGQDLFEIVNDDYIISAPGSHSGRQTLSIHSCSNKVDESQSPSPLEYHDFEGIYRFIELCDGARRR